MAKPNVVHVVGTGTIGEPLIGLLTRFKAELGIDEVTFHKYSPRAADRPKIDQLIKKGAVLACDKGKTAAFKELGHDVGLETEEAIGRAQVVIDCTPSGIGMANKEKYYNRYTDKVKGFLAQGSEFGFGKMYARGINDEVLDAAKDQFLHVVSCNTHNISAVVKTIGNNGDGNVSIESGHFLCLRRSNDISQDDAFLPAPQVGKHDDKEFGTHHARDAHHLFETLGCDLDLFSSACKLNTQYMHALQFNIRTSFDTTKEEVMARFRENRRIAITDKRSANTIFSFGREHGHYGRILSQTVISEPTLVVRKKREVVGFCFTPQDGNSLLSSVAATLWYLDRNSVEERMDCLRQFLFQEV